MTPCIPNLVTLKRQIVDKPSRRLSWISNNAHGEIGYARVGDDRRGILVAR